MNPSHPYYYKGYYIKTREHGYHAFQRDPDDDIFHAILACDDPKDAKRLAHASSEKAARKEGFSGKWSPLPKKNIGKKKTKLR